MGKIACSFNIEYEKKFRKTVLHNIHAIKENCSNACVPQTRVINGPKSGVHGDPIIKLLIYTFMIFKARAVMYWLNHVMTIPHGRKLSRELRLALFKTFHELNFEDNCTFNKLLNYK